MQIKTYYSKTDKSKHAKCKTSRQSTDFLKHVDRNSTCVTHVITTSSSACERYAQRAENGRGEVSGHSIPGNAEARWSGQRVSQLERSAAAHTSLTCSVYDDCLLTFLDNYDSVFTVSQSETFTKKWKITSFS